MQPSQNNYAFIDSQNLYLSIRKLGWKLDFKKFRKYLKEKHGVSKAYLFIGYVPQNQVLYKRLQETDYIVIFKPTVLLPNEKPKGNVDAELVMHAILELNNYDKAIIVSGDGDFFCLVDYLVKNNKLLKLIIPNKKRYSSLFREFLLYAAFISDQKEKLEYVKIK